MIDSKRDDLLAEKIVRRTDSAAALREARVACEELYQHHAPQLLAFLSNRLHHDDLEDAHQAIWERVWRLLPRSFAGGNLRAWVFQVARNYLVDCSRKKAPQLDNALDSLVDESQMLPDRRMVEQQRMADLQHCLDQLEDTTAQIVRGRLSGTAYTDICRDTGLQPPQAHKMFHQGKQQLQDCVGN